TPSTTVAFRRSRRSASLADPRWPCCSPATASSLGSSRGTSTTSDARRTDQRARRRSRLPALPGEGLHAEGSGGQSLPPPAARGDLLGAAPRLARGGAGGSARARRSQRIGEEHAPQDRGGRLAAE